MIEKKELSVAQRKLKKRKIQNYVRRLIQISFFIFFPSLFSEAFAGVKVVFAFVGQWSPIEFNAFTRTFVILCVITILFGRFFCGYACAFGSLGDFVYEIRKIILKKLKKKIPAIPQNIALVLQKIKYVNLCLILVACVLGYSNVVGENSPWTLFSRLRGGNFHLLESEIVGAILFTLICVGMFLEERFFCQFLCPLGALFALLPILPTGTLKRQASACINGCNACKKQCPVHHKPEGISVHSNECIQCRRCVSICPKGNIGTNKKECNNYFCLHIK